MLARDHWAYTEAALESLALTGHVPFETIVVDNGSTAKAAGSLQEMAHSELGRRLRLRCRFNPENVGVASGRNQGASMAEAELLLFLDNDTHIVDQTWLAQLVETLRQNAALGVVGGVLVHPDGKQTVQFAGGSVNALGRVHFGTDTAAESGYVGSARATMFALGACLLTPRALFESHRGFDPSFDPMDYEDIDYCLRLAAASRPSAIAVGSRVAHHGHITTRGDDFARMRSYMISGRTFRRRWGDCLALNSDIIGTLGET
ncbi:MAG TPA: glycosyltransferase [Acidimicrobiales bacterium]|nr:glycosyltransferase [Acidimicrobiales bacterium]